MKLKRNILFCLILAAVSTSILVAPSAISQTPEDKSIAIVVHPDTQVAELTMDEVRDVFMAKQQFWPDKSRIVLLVRAPAAYERAFVLNRIYRMNESEFKRYWIAKMFRAEIPAGPKVVLSTNMAHQLVTAIPGSITFMLASDVSEEVRVVAIDGKLPHEEGYPLK